MKETKGTIAINYYAKRIAGDIRDTYPELSDSECLSLGYQVLDKVMNWDYCLSDATEEVVKTHLEFRDYNYSE